MDQIYFLLSFSSIWSIAIAHLMRGLPDSYTRQPTLNTLKCLKGLQRHNKSTSDTRELIIGEHNQQDKLGLIKHCRNLNKKRVGVDYSELSLRAVLCVRELEGMWLWFVCSRTSNNALKV